MKNLLIRLEEPKDYRAVEEVTRAAFWREDRIKELGIGCCEHYMVHALRQKDGIKALSFVAELEGQVVGHIIYSQAHILCPDGKKVTVLNFGPLSVLPTLQKQGIGSSLMTHSLACAKALGYGAILFFGHPTYYPRFGFVEASTFGITTAWGGNFPAFMAQELIPGYLEAITGKYIEAPIYDEELNKDDAKAYDEAFTLNTGGHTYEN